MGTKSVNSFKEIGDGFLSAQEIRNKKALDSIPDFINWFTYGASGSFVQGLNERNERKSESMYGFFNYATMGLVESVDGAINPEDPFSAEHWLNSFGVAATVTGGGSLVTKPLSGGSTTIRSGINVNTKSNGATVPSNSLTLDLQFFANRGKGNAPQKVIGHYLEYVELSNKLGVKPFSIPDKVWNKMTPTEQWAANQKFLDRAITKNSEFNLATPINNVRPGSYLEKEIKYLMSNGYRLSNDGTKLVK